MFILFIIKKIILFLNTKFLLLQNSCMKTSTKILLVLFIITFVPTIFLARYLFSAIVPTEIGFVFNFDVYAYVAMSFIVVSMILGSILYIRFIFNLSLSRAIFFSVFPLSVTYAFGLYFLAVVGRYDSPIATSMKLTLNITETNNYNSILWAVLITGFYLVALMLIFAFTCKPVQKLEKITARLGDGRVKEGEFNIGGIKQFKQIENSLEKINYNYKEKENLARKTDLEAQKFIAKEFLKFLGKTSITELELGNQVQKRATTLFCDFQGENEGSESLSLKDNFNFVNSYMNMLSPLIRKYDGFIDKYMNNGVLAVFGKAEKAIDCAHAIFKEVDFKNSMISKFPKVDLKISVNTGDVVFGVVGDENRKAPTIISDVVNLASKMQDINSFLDTKLLFSKQTLNEVSTRFSFEYRYVGSLTVENGTLMAMFESLSCYDKSKKDKLSRTKIKFENGIRAYNDHDYEEAKMFFEEVLKIVPDDRAAYTYYNKAIEKVSLKNSK